MPPNRTEYGPADQIPPIWLEQLLALRERAYAPYSLHPVAALIVSTRGNSYACCNVETGHFKAVCAEAGAISAMISSGDRTIREVWILGPDICPPCGDCRQRIHEFAAAGDTPIYLIDSGGRIRQRHRISELLPFAFSGP